MEEGQHDTSAFNRGLLGGTAAPSHQDGALCSQHTRSECSSRKHRHRGFPFCSATHKKNKDGILRKHN